MLLEHVSSPGETPHHLMVSEALGVAKGRLESLTLCILGEVSEVNSKSGYKAVYFTIKDQGASLPCMMWNNRYAHSGMQLQVGMKVLVTGRFTLYAPKGRMNFDVFSLAPFGQGDLRLKIEQLSRKLQAEGLMDPAINRRLPQLPECIGVVTSPRGDAVHDVLRTLRRRFPVAKVLVAGVPVEGAQAPQALISGLRVCESAGCDVVLLVRGGGSFEDLLPFSDEALARQIRALRVPVVTGIGHEPDTTIADLVADFRASTPTGAAQAVVPEKETLKATLEGMLARMSSAQERILAVHEGRLGLLAQHPCMKDPMNLFAADALTLDMLGERLESAIPRTFQGLHASLDISSQRLVSLGKMMLESYGTDIALKASRLHDVSPLTVLARGYSMTRDSQGDLVRSVAQVQKGDQVTVFLSDGSFDCSVTRMQGPQGRL